MAGKTNDNESAIDKTSFYWVANCGICHAGGGPGEFDRDGELLYDLSTGQFGYEALGKSADDVTLDGDYAFLNPQTGEVSAARWDVTGLSEPDCLLCHRAERAIVDGKNMNWIWRSASLRGGAALVDDAGESVPAFAAASAAGQGWVSSVVLADLPGKPPKATSLQVDYSVGVADGSLLAAADGSLSLSGTSITEQPRDYSCWGCHAIADQKKRGRTWFNADHDVHYAGFNKLTDNDSANDVSPTDSTACTYCHPSGSDHNIVKGNAFSGSVTNELDYAGLLSCRDCHDAGSATRDPNAPAFTSAIHTTATHLDVMSCQFCHIPHRLQAAQLVVDNSLTGSTVAYNTDQFLSADPLDPANEDRSIWFPAFKLKADQDGTEHLFPNKLLLSAWWGDWDKNGTPGDLSDDVIEPIFLWRVRQITGGAPLDGVTDDYGDGQPEVNRLEEIASYLAALKGNDSYGRQVATNPVLVRGGRIWHDDPDADTGVGSFEYEGTGIDTESSHPFSTDHNVLPASVALGSTSCGECHTSFNDGAPTPVFDRLILIDPFGPDGQPVYQTVRQMTGIDPF